MGAVEIRLPGATRICPLVGQTLVGAGPACTWVVPAIGVPSVWLEVRFDPDRPGWRWRELALPAWAAPRPLAVWTPCVVGVEHGDPDHVVVRCTDATAPGRCLVRLRDGYVAGAAELDARVEDVAGEPRVVDRDGEPLHEGAVFAWEGEAWRFHLGVPPPATGGRGPVDLRSPTVRLRLSIDDPMPALVLTDGPHVVRVSGAALDVLVPYVRARLADPAGGYLENKTLLHWLRSERKRALEAGGPSDLRRGVRELLAAAGVVDPSYLWEGPHRGCNTAKRVRHLSWTLDPAT